VGEVVVCPQAASTLTRVTREREERTEAVGALIVRVPHMEDHRARQAGRTDEHRATQQLGPRSRCDGHRHSRPSPKPFVANITMMNAT